MLLSQFFQRRTDNSSKHAVSPSPKRHRSSSHHQSHTSPTMAAVAEKPKRGRPRTLVQPTSTRTVAAVKLPGDRTFPRNCFSLTVSRLGVDVHANAIDLISNWLSTISLKYVIANEVGSKKFNLHLQGVVDMLLPGTVEMKKVFVKLLKQQLPGNGTGYRIVFKLLAKNQTFGAMIGYVTKDSGRPHYQYRQSNVTPQVYYKFIYKT